MSREIPSDLAVHLAQPATTTTRLLKISLKDGRVFGLSMCDRDIDYDDGSGSPSGTVTYVATNGFDSSTFAADTGYSVSNAEGYALISDDVEGIEVEDIQAGALDDAEWICYLVNFEDLSMGHVVLDAGDVGEVKTKFGMVWMPELLSYIMRLKQPIGSVWSRTCRAIFGTPANSQTGCGIDTTLMWTYGEVDSVGSETNRVFTGSDLPTISEMSEIVPGRVQWLTGKNAGHEYGVEEVDADEVTLDETTGFAIEVGDTYRIRPDCAKRFVEDCIGRYSNGPNFKGEPHIPVGDGSQLQTPGAQLGSGSGFRGSGGTDEV